MFNITNAAQNHFVSLLAKQKPNTQIRVFVINPGKLDVKYKVSYCFPDSVDPTDIILEYELMFVYIDAFSYSYLQGVEIDFVVNKLDSELIFKVLNITTYKVNDTIPLIERVKSLLKLNINPQLSIHNGQIDLIRITDDMIAIIQFSGGCNGCSMVSYTFKVWIEKELLTNFPELKGVEDVTSHQHNEHSYF